MTLACRRFLDLQGDYSGTNTISGTGNIYGCYIQTTTTTLTFNSDVSSTQSTKAAQALICQECGTGSPTYSICEECRCVCDANGVWLANSQVGTVKSDSIAVADPDMPVTSDLTSLVGRAMELGYLTSLVRCVTRRSSTVLNVTPQQSAQCANRVITDLTVAGMVFTMHVSRAGLLYVPLAPY